MNFNLVLLVDCAFWCKHELLGYKSNHIKGHWGQTPFKWTCWWKQIKLYFTFSLAMSLCSLLFYIMGTEMFVYYRWLYLWSLIFLLLFDIQTAVSEMNQLWQRNLRQLRLRYWKFPFILLQLVGRNITFLNWGLLIPLLNWRSEGAANWWCIVSLIYSKYMPWLYHFLEHYTTLAIFTSSCNKRVDKNHIIKC